MPLPNSEILSKLPADFTRLRQVGSRDPLVRALNAEIKRVQALKQSQESETRYEHELRAQVDHDAEMSRCSTDLLHWMDTWCWTYDPRLIGQPGGAFVPFKPWPRQREFLHWVLARIKANEPWLVAKSRDQGATYLLTALCVHCWLYWPGFKATFGSRVEDLVDNRDNPDAIFEKMRIIIRRLPPWMLPKGFSWHAHDLYMRLVNPSNGAVVTGEGGKNMGRGGRAQPLTAKVLTPAGWRTMGEMQTGDLVIGADGTATRVLTVHPQGVKPIFRVTFSDGASTECCDDHLWQVTNRECRKVVARKGNRTYGARHHVIRLAEIRDNLKVLRPDGQAEFRFRIPMMQAATFTPSQLPLHPYLIGSLLGDGSLSQIKKSSVGFTISDVESVETLSALLPPNHEMVNDGSPYGFRIVDRGPKRGAGNRSILKAALFELGMAGHTAASKSVPPSYMTGSIADRLDLLRGLLDTDGWVGQRKERPNASSRVCFGSISRRLADDVAEIVRSLGGAAVITSREGQRREFPGGRAYDCQRSFQVTIAMPDGMNPFRLTRKAALYKERAKYKPGRSIVSIEPVGDAEAKCITVDAEDGLYVTDDYIVTHNSSVYILDECAFVEHAETVEAAISANTECIGYVSTVNHAGDFFDRKRLNILKPHQLFRLHWRDDPRKTDAWAEEKKLSLADPTAWEREYEINSHASSEDVCIPAAHVESAKLLAQLLPDIPLGKGIAGGDVGGGKAKSVLIRKFGPLIMPALVRSEADTTETALWMMRECKKAGIKTLNYDSVGIGAGVQSTMNRTNDPELDSVVRRGINTGSPASERRKWPDGRSSKDMFGNLKAELWWMARQAFARTHAMALFLQGKPGGKEYPLSEIIALHETASDSSLSTQISLVKWFRNEKGVIVIETKKQLSMRNIASPDYADALVLAFLEELGSGIPDMDLSGGDDFKRENPYALPGYVDLGMDR